jgi:uncharacterized membrane protein
VATDPQIGALTEDNRRASKAITLVAATVLLVGALVFLLESDSWYLAFKAVHVVSAVLWIGGGAFLTFMAMATERSDDPGRLIEVARQAEWGATRIFVPASFVVLGMGIAMTINGDLDWGQFWLVFGLVAWAISTAIGVGFLTPRIKTLNSLIDERGERDPAVQAAVRPILLAARLDIALLLLIVIDMTVKPSF